MALSQRSFKWVTLQLTTEHLDLLWFFGLTFPHDDAVPAQLAQDVLVDSVAGGVAFEFQPSGATMRWRRAVLAAAMTMPKTAVNEVGGFVFRKKNIHRNSARSSTPLPDPLPGRGGEGIERNRHSHVQTETIAEPMQQ